VGHKLIIQYADISAMRQQSRNPPSKLLLNAEGQHFCSFSTGIWPVSEATGATHHPGESIRATDATQMLSSRIFDGGFGKMRDGPDIPVQI